MLIVVLHATVHEQLRHFKRSLSSTDYCAWSAELSKIKALYKQKTSTYWQNEIATGNSNNCRLWHTQKRAGWVRKCWHRRQHSWRLCRFFPWQGSVSPCMHHDYTIQQRPVQVNANAGVLVACDHKRSGEADQLGIMQNHSTWPSSNVANKGHEATVNSIDRVAVQQVTGFRLLPHNFKNSVVHPLLEKEVLDAGQMKNYRPVLNLSFLSKH